MRIADPGAVLVARQLYEGLTRWDPARRRVVPAAARSWRASRGGRVFTFILRRNMTFHDGSPVTAASFRRAFDRIARKPNRSDLAYTLEGVEGFFAVHGTGKRKRLSGVEALSRLRLRITLTRPSYELPTVLTHPGLVPLPRLAFHSPARFRRRPIGNGPFALVRRWRPSAPVRLEAFEGALRPPRLDGLRFVPFRDAAASWVPFTAGELDVAEVPAGEIASARESFGVRGFVPLAAGLFFGLNVRSPAMRDRAVRAALSHAIDRRAIARDIFKGTLVGPSGIVPAGLPGFGPRRCPICRYAPARARAAVRRLEPRLRRITVDFDADRLQRRVAGRIKADLERAGFDVRLRAWPIDRYLLVLARREAAMYRFGWIAEYPTAEAFLAPLFGSRSPDNHSGFASKRVDTLLRRARAEPSARRRLALYRRAEKTILRDAPVVPLGSFRMRWAAQPDVRGLRFDATGGFDAATVRLADG
jgi:oligopeptide transport system substrate-binding protein